MSKIYIANRYGVAPNHLLNDENISLKAKGLYVFIQSKPDGWNFSAKKISAQTKDGLESINSGLKELEDSGYLKRKKYQDTKGYWQIDYYLFENPRTEKPRTGFPLQENHLNNSNKDYSKQDKVKKNESSNEVALMISLFEKIDLKNKKYYGNKTQREKAQFLLDEYGVDRISKIIDVYLKCKGDKFLPSISSPYDLVEKWSKLEDYFLRKKAEVTKYAENVIF